MRGFVVAPALLGLVLASACRDWDSLRGAAGGGGVGGDAATGAGTTTGNGGSVCDDPGGAEGTAMWTRTFGGDGSAEATAVASAPDGSTWVAGSFEGELDLDGSLFTAVGMSSDIFIAKLDCMGSVVFKDVFAGASPDEPADIAIAPNGDVVLLASVGDNIHFGGQQLNAGLGGVAIVKLTADGDHIWSHAFSTAGSLTSASSVALDDAGDVHMIGTYDGSIDFGGGVLTGGPMDFNAFVAKRSGATGAHVTAFGYGDSSDQLGHDIAIVDGTPLVAGLNFGNIDFGNSASSVVGAPADLFFAGLTEVGEAAWLHPIDAATTSQFPLRFAATDSELVVLAEIDNDIGRGARAPRGDHERHAERRRALHDAEERRTGALVHPLRRAIARRDRRCEDHVRR